MVCTPLHLRSRMNVTAGMTRTRIHEWVLTLVGMRCVLRITVHFCRFIPERCMNIQLRDLIEKSRGVRICFLLYFFKLSAGHGFFLTRYVHDVLIVNRALRLVWIKPLREVF